MADQTVGGIDGLVGVETRQTRHGQPEGGGDDAVVEAFGQTFDRGGGHARLVQVGGVAADDAADRQTRGGQIGGFQRQGDGGDMVVKTALGQAQGGGRDRRRARKPRRRQTRQRRDAGDARHRRRPRDTPRGRRPFGAVQPSLGRVDQGAQTDDRMGQDAVQTRRIADRRLADQGRQGQPGLAPKHGGSRRSADRPPPGPGSPPPHRRVAERRGSGRRRADRRPERRPGPEPRSGRPGAAPG